MFNKKLMSGFIAIFLILAAAGLAKADGNNGPNGDGGGGDTPTPKLQIIPTAQEGVSFDSQLINTESTSRTILIKNIGDANSQIKMKSVTLEGQDQGDFFVQTGRCNTATVTPASPCSLPIRFTPLTEGRKGIRVRIETTLNEINFIPVLGIGLATPPEPGPPPQQVPPSDNPGDPNSPKPELSNKNGDVNGGGCSLALASPAFHWSTLFSFFFTFTVFGFRRFRK